MALLERGSQRFRSPTIDTSKNTPFFLRLLSGSYIISHLQVMNRWEGLVSGLDCIASGRLEQTSQPCLLRANGMY